MFTIGDRLKSLRESLDLKQKDVAIKLQLNNKTLSNYENNVSSPDPTTIKLLCEFYNVSSDYLLGISKLNPPNTSNTYLETVSIQTPLTLENRCNYKNNTISSYSLSSEETKILMYYNRLNEENKDSVKGTMVNLYRDELSQLNDSLN